jgi:hypothetical protein
LYFLNVNFIVDFSALVASGSEDEADDNAASILLSAASVDVYSRKRREVEPEENVDKETAKPQKPEKSKFKAKLVAKKKRKLVESASHLPADLEDSRFAALYASSDFAIDKTNPHYRGGALADQQVQEKIRRKK